MNMPSEAEKIEKAYEKALAKFFDHSEEEALFEVSEIGKKLVFTKLGPDVLLEFHSRSLKKIMTGHDPIMMSRLVVNADELLINGIMSYGMSYYGFMDALDSEKKKLKESQIEILNERNKLDDIISAIDADLLLLDTDMKVLWVNKRLKERPFYTGKDIIGRFCNLAYCNIEEIPDNCPAKLTFISGDPIQGEHTGIGISKDDQSRLFAAFEQIDNHLRIKTGGSGLGLYITKKMTTDILCGSVDIKSIEGKGSIFSIKIPKILKKKGEKK